MTPKSAAKRIMAIRGDIGELRRWTCEHAARKDLSADDAQLIGKLQVALFVLIETAYVVRNQIRYMDKDVFGGDL